MKFSTFGDKFNGPTGIGNLMDDLGKATVKPIDRQDFLESVTRLLAAA